MMRYLILALLVFFSVTASGLLMQKAQTIETVREVLKLQPVERTVEKVVSEVKIGDLLLPDLVIEPPGNLFISGSGERKRLRFSTEFTNRGEGPFEVLGHTDQDRQTTFATQYIKKKDGTGLYREIGNFIYHPEHKHWHVANHVEYKLWTINPDGSKGEQLSSSGKMSICLFDDHSADLTLPGAPQKRVYPFSCNTLAQGVSVGWSDIYLSRIEGQEIDVSKLSDGRYFFSYEINPDRKVLEKEYSNNVGMIKVDIKGSKVTKVTE